MVFYIVLYVLRKQLFLANLTTSVRIFFTEIVKRPIYGPRPFIWAYNQVSVTFRSKALAHTSSSLEKTCYFGLFWPIWPLPVRCFWPKLSKGTSTDQWLSFEPITKSLWPFVQKFLPVQKSMTDRQTDGHPKPIGPQPFGLGPNKRCHTLCIMPLNIAPSQSD